MYIDSKERYYYGRWMIFIDNPRQIKKIVQNNGAMNEDA